MLSKILIKKIINKIKYESIFSQTFICKSWKIEKKRKINYNNKYIKYLYFHFIGFMPHDDLGGLDC